MAKTTEKKHALHVYNRRQSLPLITGVTMSLSMTTVTGLAPVSPTAPAEADAPVLIDHFDQWGSEAGSLPNVSWVTWVDPVVSAG